jgi:hypothetical protein
MQQHSGGCQCGSVRYKISGQLGAATICHCRMCQKAFGSWGAALVDVPLQFFEWTRGQPTLFKSSPIVERGFCSACGTPLFMHEHDDTNIEIAIGTMDNPNAIGTLQNQVGVESRVSWFQQMAHLREHQTQATRTAEDLAKLKTLQHPDFDTVAWPPKLWPL